MRFSDQSRTVPCTFGLLQKQMPVLEKHVQDDIGQAHQFSRIDYQSLSLNIISQKKHQSPFIPRHSQTDQTSQSPKHPTQNQQRVQSMPIICQQTTPPSPPTRRTHLDASSRRRALPAQHIERVPLLRLHNSPVDSVVLNNVVGTGTLWPRGAGECDDKGAACAIRAGHG
jgi:hypothetical protein